MTGRPSSSQRSQSFVHIQGEWSGQYDRCDRPSGTIAQFAYAYDDVQNVDTITDVEGFTTTVTTD